MLFNENDTVEPDTELTKNNIMWENVNKGNI